MDNDNVILEVRDVTKRFPGVVALDSVNVRLRAHEGHAMLGENGAGKSTLMNIVVGLLQPDAGEILIAGKPAVIDSPAVAQTYGIGMVPQELTLSPQLSVMENISLGNLPLRAGGTAVDWKRTAEIADNVMATMGEHIDVRTPVGRLGAAQQQIVQIARSLAFGAKILILDEPTASLTDRETDRLFETIRRFRENGGAFFYISHRLEEIKRICDQMTILRDGKKIIDLPVADSSVKDIVRHMVGREMEPPKAKTPKEAGREVLRVEGLTRQGEFENISFSLKEGEILGFAGLVGAGRTELMRCIIGDTQPDSGSVLFGDPLRRISFRHPRDSIRARIAYLPEERRNLGIFPKLSVRENMAITVFRSAKRYLGIDRAKVERSVAEYVRELDIKLASQNQPIENLSGGNQQKVIIARWLLKGSRLLILDEPTRGIDVKAKREIYDLLRRLIDRGGMSIIVVSSELQELLDVSDRIVVVHEGVLKGEIVPEAGTTQEDVMRLAFAG